MALGLLTGIGDAASPCLYASVRAIFREVSAGGAATG